MGDRQHARQTEKHAALARLATGMVHEFNNLLMVIVGNAELGLLTAEPDSPARASLERILNAGENAANFCKQIMAFAGRIRLELRPTDLGRLLDGMQTTLAAAASQAEFRWQLAQPVRAIEADAPQLTQLVEQLVANAAEALPSTGGTITLRTGLATVDHDAAAWLAPPDFPPGPCVFLEVADTGAGMDRATVDNAFDPFFSTRSKGRGLGLARVLGIARAHRAAISIDSQLGQGTRVRVFFPSSATAAEAGIEFGQVPAWHGSGGALVIDADESGRTVAGALLEHFGFDTLLATGVSHAVQVLREHAGQISAIFLAGPMADLDESLAGLRELAPDAKILLSGTDQLVGGDGVVRKPYDAAQLATALQSVLG